MDKMYNQSQSQIAANAQTTIQINWVGVRGNREPIDSSSVMLTYTELTYYLANNKSVYDGQLVSVSDLEDTTYNGIYYVKYDKDYNNNYAYVANLVSLNDFSLLLQNNIITNERIVSLMNNYLHDNICKNEETLSVAINYLYSYIHTKASIIEEELQKNELLFSDYFTYVFSILKNLNKLRIDENANTFTDNEGNVISLMLRNENGYDYLYFDKYTRPSFTYFGYAGSNSLSLEYGDNTSNISVDNIYYTLRGSLNQYEYDLYLKEYEKNTQNSSWSLINDRKVLTFTDDKTGPIPENNWNTVKSLFTKSTNGFNKWGYKINFYLEAKDDTNSIISEEKELYFDFHTNRYSLKLSTDSISNSLNYSDLTLIDNDGENTDFTNQTLPASSTGEYFYLLFNKEGTNYDVCILNNTLYSDNTRIYGPVSITNKNGKVLQYYYWKKKLGSLSEKVTLKLNADLFTNDEPQNNTGLYRYWLKLSTDSISNNLSYNQLNYIDNNYNEKTFVNYKLPASSTGEYYYLLFSTDDISNYTSCILNYVYNSDNKNVYGPVNVTNNKGNIVQYYYWKKKLSNQEEVITIIK